MNCMLLRCAPLHMASANDRSSFATALLAKGARVDQRAPALDDCTPLHVASLNGFTTIVAILLSAGTGKGKPKMGKKKTLIGAFFFFSTRKHIHECASAKSTTTNDCSIHRLIIFIS
jgi:ankyrin repeat protein